MLYIYNQEGELLLNFHQWLEELELLLVWMYGVCKSYGEHICSILVIHVC